MDGWTLLTLVCFFQEWPSTCPPLLPLHHGASPLRPVPHDPQQPCTCTRSHAQTASHMRRTSRGCLQSLFQRYALMIINTQEWSHRRHVAKCMKSNSDPTIVHTLNWFSSCWWVKVCPQDSPHLHRHLCSCLLLWDRPPPFLSYEGTFFPWLPIV